MTADVPDGGAPVRLVRPGGASPTQIVTGCPNCSTRFRAPRYAVGRKVTCRRCGQVFRAHEQAPPTSASVALVERKRRELSTRESAPIRIHEPCRNERHARAKSGMGLFMLFAIAIGVPAVWVWFEDPDAADDSKANASFGAPRPTKLSRQYVALAKVLAEPMSSKPEAETEDTSAAELLAAIQSSKLDLRNLQCADREVETVRNEALRAVVELERSIRHMQKLPKPPGGGELFLDGLARGLMGLGANERLTNEIENTNWEIQREARTMLAAVHRIRAAQLLLPRIAARCAKSTGRKAKVLGADFNGSWGPFGPNDWLTLWNASNRTLHNVTLVVELRGRSGESCRNVHFISSWEPGAARYARYKPGWLLLDEYVERTTVANVENLTFSIWCDELSREGIRYDYAGTERSKDIRRYCEDVRVSVSYQPYEPGVFWDNHRGVVLQLGGIAYLPHPRITARFRRGGKVKSWYWDFERWDQGQSLTLETGGQLAWDPTSVEIELGFPDNGFKTVYAHRMRVK